MNSMLSVGQFPDYELPGAKHPDFSPYDSNGGTIVAVAGEDYAIIAADTRLSSGYSIYTRGQKKLFELSNLSVLGSTGCWCDTLALTSLVRARMQMYEHLHLKTMTTEALAQMLSLLMYNKRFFPYYVSNILAGLDADGKGAVYSYDPIGHFERSTYRAGGTGGVILQPVLDSQIGFKNKVLSNGEEPKVSKDQAIKLIMDTFTSATERDIYTGDAVYMTIITKEGITTREMSLRKD